MSMLPVLRWWCVAILGIAPLMAHAQEDPPSGPDVLPADVASALAQARLLELLALDPEPRKVHCRNCLHQYRIRKSVQLRGSRRIDALRDAIQAAVQGGDAGETSLCFVPRHGVRFLRPKQPFSLVICFECGAIEIRRDDGQSDHVSIGEVGQDALDRLLHQRRHSDPEE